MIVSNRVQWTVPKPHRTVHVVKRAHSQPHQSHPEAKTRRYDLYKSAPPAYSPEDPYPLTESSHAPRIEAPEAPRRLTKSAYRRLKKAQAAANPPPYKQLPGEPFRAPRQNVKPPPHPSPGWQWLPVPWREDPRIHN